MNIDRFSLEFTEGYGSRFDGKPVTANPYPANSVPRLNWDAGWREANKDGEALRIPDPSEEKA